MQTQKSELNPLLTPSDALIELDKIRLGNVEKGHQIGNEKWDEHILFKRGQFNMVNGHDNVGKTDVLLWYFVCLAKQHNLKFNIYSSENTHRSQVFKLFNFWTGKRMDKDFLTDERGFQNTINEITDCFKFIRADQRYSSNQILDIADKYNADGLLIDPFNSLTTESTNKHQEDYDTCANIRIFCDTTNTTTFVNAHLVTQAARNVFPKDHEYEGNLRPGEKADTEGGQKFANRADDFWSIHRMTQHPELWSTTEVHVRKVKETITGGSTTQRDNPILMKWENHCKYTINGKNPLINSYSDVGDKNKSNLGETSLQHKTMSKMSYPAPEDDLPF
tara:strand:+ start:1259 stop:2260 length:1002 start_codon:yes stop_codon:yes gene_type:complete